MKWFWLSFADGSLPKGEQFLGAVVIAVDEAVVDLMEELDGDDRIDTLRRRGQFEDIDFFAAVQWTHFLGINPGGEVEGHEIPENLLYHVPEDMRGRLLTPEEARSI